MRNRWLPLALLLPTLAGAAETAEELERGRRRAGLWAGPALVQGRFEFEAPTARFSTRLDALPALAAGLELWPDESLGLYLGAAVGLGADLELPQGGTLAYAAHQVEAGARYRWFLGPHSDAAALFTAFGVRGVHQSIQEQRPSLLVSTTTVGPEVSAGLELPLGPLWLRGAARGGLPFFVRESPTDSGDPQRYFAWGGRVEAVLDIAGDWSAQIVGDALIQAVEYRGDGTRAAGVTGGRTDDRLLTVMLLARHRL